MLADVLGCQIPGFKLRLHLLQGRLELLALNLIHWRHECNMICVVSAMRIPILNFEFNWRSLTLLDRFCMLLASVQWCPFVIFFEFVLANWVCPSVVDRLGCALWHGVIGCPGGLLARSCALHFWIPHPRIAFANCFNRRGWPPLAQCRISSKPTFDVEVQGLPRQIAHGGHSPQSYLGARGASTQNKIRTFTSSIF